MTSRCVNPRVLSAQSAVIPCPGTLTALTAVADNMCSQSEVPRCPWTLVLRDRRYRRDDAQCLSLLATGHKRQRASPRIRRRDLRSKGGCDDRPLTGALTSCYSAAMLEIIAVEWATVAAHFNGVKK